MVACSQKAERADDGNEEGGGTYLPMSPISTCNGPVVPGNKGAGGSAEKTAVPTTGVGPGLGAFVGALDVFCSLTAPGKEREQQ